MKTLRDLWDLVVIVVLLSVASLLCPEMDERED